AATADDGSGNYHDYDWGDETAEMTAVRLTEEQLGLRELRRTYLPPVTFDIASLRGLTPGELSAREDAEHVRVLDLIEYLPAALELEEVIKHQAEPDIDGEEALELLEAMDIYLDWCIGRLDDIGTLDPLNMRFVRKMLGLPRNTPTMKIYDVYDE